MHRKIRYSGLIAISVALILLCSCVIKPKNISEIPQAENDFLISILKVGQADAIILKTDNHTAVIDCGEEDDGAEVVEHLTNAGAKQIDYLFITHFDKDHVGGASEVIENFETSHIIMPDYVSTSDEYKTFKNTMQEKNIAYNPLTDELTFTLDDVLFEVYPPLKQSYNEPDNDYSLVISVKHGNNSFLFTGDAEKDRLKELQTQLDLDHDFLKMPHHGNYNKGTTTFLKSVTPTYTVITDSNKNPAETETIDVLKAVGSEIYHTKDGDIEVISDGKTIAITQ